MRMEEYIVTLPVPLAAVVTVKEEAPAVSTVYAPSTPVPLVKSSHTRSPATSVFATVTVIVVEVMLYVPSCGTLSAKTVFRVAAVVFADTITDFKRVR